MYLVYINKVGKNYQSNFLYEFIFSTTTDKIDGEEWDAYPASGRPEPPSDKFINKVGRLESELKLDVIQDSDSFGIWDAVDGVISLAWEDVAVYDDYPEKRLHFKFGEPINSVEDKLYEKDLKLNYNFNK